jgi:hypothetical protein
VGSQIISTNSVEIHVLRIKREGATALCAGNTQLYAEAIENKDVAAGLSTAKELSVEEG